MPNTMNKKLGVYLKESRKKFNFKLRAVEEKTGISNAYLSQLENNKIANPSPSILHKLANCYNLSYSYLMQLAGHPVPEESINNKKGISPSFRLSNNFNNLTKEEEKKLLEYLQFLRLRKQKK